VREQTPTDAFLAFNDFGVVSVGCYAQIKRLHSAKI
jgi:hypothetical protein